MTRTRAPRPGRFNYRGVVVGYDPTCQQSESWMRTMGVDWLKHGRHQPFYHVLPDTRDRPGAQAGCAPRHPVARPRHPDARPSASCPLRARARA